MTSKYLGMHIPYGVIDEGIHISLPLTSDDTDGIGRGDIIGTGHTIDSNGFKPSGSIGSAIEFDSTQSENIIPDVTDLDTGFTVEFDVEKQALLDLTTSTIRYLFAWTKNGSSNAGRISVAGFDATENIMSISPRFTNGGSDSAVWITLTGKGDTVNFKFSFRYGYLDVFVDNAWIASWPMQDYLEAASPKIEKLWIAGHTALNGPAGYFSNLQINKTPISLANDLRVTRVAYVGDSIMADGQWPNNTDYKYKGTDYAVDQDEHYDAGSAPECHRYFAEKDMHVEVCDFADSSDSIQETGSNDVMDQVDGTGSFDATSIKAPWVVLLAGYNDINTGNPDVTTTGAGTFYAWYKAIVDKIRERSPNSKILCLSMHSRELNASYAGATNQTETNNANARIQDVVDYYGEGVYFGDFFTELGGHSISATLCDTDDFHLSELGSRALGRFIGKTIYGLI
jgi:lysophospholipase L1-like esterase